MRPTHCQWKLHHFVIQRWKNWLSTSFVWNRNTQYPRWMSNSSLFDIFLLQTLMTCRSKMNGFRACEVEISFYVSSEMLWHGLQWSKESHGASPLYTFGSCGRGKIYDILAHEMLLSFFSRINKCYSYMNYWNYSCICRLLTEMVLPSNSPRLFKAHWIKHIMRLWRKWKRLNRTLRFEYL